MFVNLVKILTSLHSFCSLSFSKYCLIKFTILFFSKKRKRVESNSESNDKGVGTKEEEKPKLSTDELWKGKLWDYEEGSLAFIDLYTAYQMLVQILGCILYWMIFSLFKCILEKA